MGRVQRAVLALGMAGLLGAPAMASPSGDVNLDGLVDAADVLLVERHLDGELTLSPAQHEAADVAPLVGGAPAPDGSVGVADLTVLIRHLRGELALPAVNTAPVLDPIGDKTLSAGDTLAIQLGATDPEGAQLTFSVAPLPLPAHASFGVENAEFTFSPNTAQVGDHVFTFAVSDGEASDAEQITITVPAPGAGDPTAVQGTILDAVDAEAGTTTPVEGVTVTDLDSGLSTTTGPDGVFALSGLAAGEREIDIDGSTAVGAIEYGSFRRPVEVEANVTRVIDRPIFLPPKDPGGSATIQAGMPTPVSNPGIGVSMEIPADTAMDDQGQPYTGEISISEVPAAFTPGELPAALDPALVITVQPVGIAFSDPVPITFPNVDSLPVGEQVDIWSLNHDTGRFFISGVGEVTPDGMFIQTIEGGIRDTSWHAALPPATATAVSDQADGDTHDPEKAAACPVASELIVPTGAVVADVTLPDHVSQGQGRSTRLVYRSDRAHPAVVLPFEPTVLRRAAVPELLSHTVRVGGVAQGVRTFYETQSAGLSESQDEPLRLAALIDGTDLPTGVYPVEVEVTSHYAGSGATSVIPEEVVVVNGAGSALGVGWGLAGLQRLHVQPDGRVLREDGAGGFAIYEPRPTLLDLTGWETQKPVGSWQLSAGGTSVERLEAPGTGGGRLTFFVSPDDVFNETILGDFQVQTTGDDDWIGFVVGYRRPVAAHGDADSDFEFILFDWRQRFQADFAGFPAQEGMALARVVGSFPTLDDEAPFFVGHADGPPEYTLLGTRFGPDTGWEDGTTHSFEVEFGTSRLGVQIDGEEVFDIPGTFQPGRFGFYNFSQPNVRYRVFADTSDTAFDSPPGDFSALTRNGDGSFTRRLPDGTEIQFDPSGLQTAVVDRNGNTTTYAYDAQDRLASVTDPVGRETTFDHLGPGGRLSKITDPAGRETLFEHDAEGNLRRVVLPNGADRRFDYDGRNLMTEETDERGLSTQRAFDFAGRLLTVTLPDQAARAAGPAQIVGLVDPATGSGTAMNPAPVARPDDAESLLRDAETRETIFETGGLGAATKITDPANLTTTIERDGDANPTCTVRPSGHETTRTFDAVGHLLTATDQVLGGTTTFTRHPDFGSVTSITDDRDETTVLEYDPVDGDLEEIRSPLGRTTTFTYDPANPDGLPETMTDVFGTETELVYDPATRNPTHIRQAVGTAEERETVLSYTPEGYLDTLTDPEGRVTDFAYDALGRVEVQTFPDLRQVTFAYDDAGNLVSLTPPGRPAHVFRYDDRGREAEYEPPDLPGIADERTLFDYDAEGLLELVSRPDGSSVDPVYDAAGRLDALVIPRGTYDLVYDPATGTLDQLLAPGAETLTFDYGGPDSSLLHGVTWSGSVSGTVDWDFDADGRLRDRRVGGVELDPAQDDFAYDADGLRVRAGALAMTRDPASGFLTQTDLAQVRTTRAPNAFGERQSDAAVFDPGGANVLLYENQYTERDGLGRLETKVETIQGTTTTFEYSYDLAGRLDTVRENGVLVADYGYDANGNRTHLREDLGGPPVASYDAQDRLVSFEGTTYTFDAAGDLESQVGPEGTTSYAYDALGNLVQVDLPDGRTITYVIDGQNRRVGKKVDGVLVRAWLYQDQLNPVAELDGAGNVVARFVYGSRPNVPDYMVKGGTTYRILSDHLGSVRLVVDADTGAIAQRLDYDEWGVVEQDTNSGFQPFGFAGGIYDSDTGLVRFGARDYDPETGRWTTKDSIRFEGGDASLYGYVQNNPLNSIDPTGEAFIANLSNRPVRSSRTREGGGQEVFDIPPGGTSGFKDADTLIADDGSVIKLPDPQIVVVTDGDSQESFDEQSVRDADRLPLIPDPRFRPRLIPDPEAEFGPFFNPDGTRFIFPGDCK